MKKIKIILLISYIVFSAQISYAIEGRVQYDKVNVDYSILDEKEFSQKGDYYLNKSYIMTDKDQRNRYIGYAAGAYETVYEINPRNGLTLAKLAYCHGKLGKYQLAKSYFFKALNLDHFNPQINYYFGEFYYDNDDYLKALKYYHFAYEHGYSNNYQLNYDMAVLYEKLGDLKNAIKFYNIASNISPDAGLQDKIRSLDKLQYDKSHYYLYNIKYKI